MAKIPVSLLIADFRRMTQENWRYVAGSASTGEVDCSGAFVWAYRQHGCSIYHGSNRIARTEVIQLMKIGSTTIVPGMVAFKCRQPGLFTGYDLPDDYLLNGDHYNGDLGDYYHIGLVDNNTNNVLNAQSAKTGFVTSDIHKGGWTHVAYLKQVDYGADQPYVEDDPEPEEPTPIVPPTSQVTMARVVASSGSTVNIRKTPSKKAALVERVPIGTIIDITGAETDGWYPVQWGKWSGYMMAEFLEPISSSSSSSPNFGETYSVTIFDLTAQEASELKSKYPNASIIKTVG